MRTKVCNRCDGVYLVTIETEKYHQTCPRRSRPWDKIKKLYNRKI